MIILSGALSAMLAVAFGAFGAHGLKNKLPADLMSTYQTAADYHIYHSLGLLLVGIIAMLAPNIAAVKISGYLMLVGVVIFSGSLYLLALTGVRWLGAITPIGGIFLLAAWAVLAWGEFTIVKQQ